MVSTAIPISLSNGIGSAGQGRIFELVGGHPLLDLVNTLDWRFREEGSEEFLETYKDLLDFAEQSQLIAPRQTRRMLRAVNESAAHRVLASVKELREGAASVFYSLLDGAAPAAATIKTLEKYFRSARDHQRLTWSDGRLVWDWTEADPSPELVLWLPSLSAAHLMTSEDMQRVRACGNAECRWLFLDTSKNHTRRWCDMRICGNRMKARRFKAQRRG